MPIVAILVLITVVHLSIELNGNRASGIVVAPWRKINPSKHSWSH